MELIVKYCGYITAIAAAITILIKIFSSVVSIREGQKCLLRSEMLKIYYKHHETNEIRQYEKEHFMYCYKAYKALRGNSFIEDICKEVREWEVLT